MDLTSLYQTHPMRFFCKLIGKVKFNLAIFRPILTFFRMKMKIGRLNRKLDESNMKDLLETFKKRNQELVNKREKYEVGSSLIETCPEFIPKSINEVASVHKRFNKAAKSAGLPALGSREYKMALACCIKNLLKLACPQLVNDADFTFAPSLSAEEMNTKISKILLLYKLSLPLIRQNVVYA